MSNKRLFLAITVVLSISSTPVLAEPCGAVLCLSTNKSMPQECKEHVDGYFNIRVYHDKHHVFDPGATAAKRYNEVLNSCSNARQEDKDFVNATYGPLEYFPGSYM